jgi:DNA-binding MarR family transcriptional regulator
MNRDNNRALLILQALICAAPWRTGSCTCSVGDMPRQIEIGEDFRGPDGHVAFLLRQAHSALRAVIERELSPLGLTGPQYSALNVIARSRGLSGTELARASMLTQQTTNEILLALARQRLIKRRPRAGNRRVLEVDATDRGRRIVGQARRIVYRIERRMVGDLDAHDQARLRQFLVLCARALADDLRSAAAERSRRTSA